MQLKNILFYTFFIITSLSLSTLATTDSMQDPLAQDLRPKKATNLQQGNNKKYGVIGLITRTVILAIVHRLSNKKRNFTPENPLDELKEAERLKIKEEERKKKEAQNRVLEKMLERKRKAKNKVEREERKKKADKNNEKKKLTQELRKKNNEKKAKDTKKKAEEQDRKKKEELQKKIEKKEKSGDNAKEKNRQKKRKKSAHHNAVSRQLKVSQIAHGFKPTYYVQKRDKNWKITRRKKIFVCLDERPLPKESPKGAKEWYDRIFVPKKLTAQFMAMGKWYPSVTAEIKAIRKLQKSNLPLKPMQQLVKEYINRCTSFEAKIDHEKTSNNYFWTASIPCGYKYSFEFSPDGKRFAVWENLSVKLYDTDSGKQIGGAIPCGYEYSFRFSADGKRLAAQHNRSVTLYDADSGSQIGGSIPCLSHLSFRFNGYGKRLAAQHNRSVTLYDADSGKQIGGAIPCGYKYSFRFSADGKRLAFYQNNKKRPKISGFNFFAWEKSLVKLYNADSGKQIGGAIPCFSECSFEFSPDGKRLAAQHNRSITLYDADSGKKIGGAIPCQFSFRFSADGKRLAVYDKDIVKIYDAASGSQIGGSIPCLSHLSFRFNGYGKRLAVYDKGLVKLYNADSGKQIGGAIPCGSEYPFEFSPDGKRLAAQHNRSITLYDADSGKKIGGAIPCSYEYSFRFSGYGKRLAVFDKDIVKIYDAASGSQIGGSIPCLSHLSFRFSRDSKHLLVQDKDSITLYGPYAPLTVVPKNNNNFVPDTLHPSLFSNGTLKISNKQFQASLDLSGIMVDKFIDNGVGVRKKVKDVFSSKQKYIVLQAIFQESLKETEKEYLDDNQITTKQDYEEYTIAVESFPCEIEFLIIAEYLPEILPGLELEKYRFF